VPHPQLTPSARALEIVARLRDEPAPLLAILHALQDELGHLPEAELNTVADALRIPAGDLFGVVTFYHYFRTAPAPTHWVCEGPACRMHAQSGAPLPRGSHIAWSRATSEGTPNR